MAYILKYIFTCLFKTCKRVMGKKMQQFNQYLRIPIKEQPRRSKKKEFRFRSKTDKPSTNLLLINLNPVKKAIVTNPNRN